MNINTFNYQQKIAMMRILLDIINADGRIDSREVFYFNQLKDTFQLTDNSRIDVDEKNSLLALVQVKSFSDEQKDLFADIMARMIVVDEDINVNEAIIYDVVREFASIGKELSESIDSFSK